MQVAPIKLAPGMVIYTPWHSIAIVENVRDMYKAFTVVELVGGLSFSVANNKTLIRVVN